ncbi:MAG: penicillin-binding protein [Ruminococcaceae bacterium]|nr:penicillin-binding protein [Oscillospiraceae bacterium]
MPFQKKSQLQLTILSIFLVIALLLYTVRMYSLQIQAHNDKNGIIAGTKTLTAVLKAPRGEILDCYGRKIAVNRDGYNIVFNKAYVKNDLNDVILSLIKLMQENNLEWIDKLPMHKNEPYGFIEGESTAKLIKKLKLAHYATAQNCFEQMVKKYKLSKYSPDEQRLIMGVRYSMDIADFSISYPYTFAEDIPTELMRKISESAFLYAGITVDVVPFREYVDTTLAVNLIGTVGPIFEEDWDKADGANYKSKGYSYNDKVGKSGIEYWAEEYLHGTDGQIAYTLDSKGNIISSQITREPIAGKTVMLTLDKSIQRTAQNSLETVIKKLQSEGGTVTAGSAVMIDVKTSGIICGANYPTYDSATMNQNYEQLLADPAKPLTNRAFQGVYPIGSTIKPAVAVAALENNHYTQGETIRCVHTYKLFGDYQPSCMGYHGSIALKTALAKSCNYFFFELGRRIGATTLTDYFKQFGLGVKTGVEVDDSAGILIQPESDGVGGDTLQISIGQMNAFTPLQLANYAATLSNGGTHHKATLIDKIVSYDLTDTFLDNQPVVLNTVNISESTLKAVKEGMLSVTVDGTGRTVFSDYPIKIGGKTGTSQVTNKADHSTYIVFAPYENPEVAISVILEHGSSGYSAGTVVKELLDAYFFFEDNATQPTPPYMVLS